MPAVNLRHIEIFHAVMTAGNLTVSEVAERVGYLKHSQFSEAFQRRYGVLPKDY